MGLYLILAIVVLIGLSVFTYFIASKSPIMRHSLNVVYTLAILVLAYFLFSSIQKPIQFEKGKKERYEETIKRLKKIKDTQFAYKSVYGKYTGSLDTLYQFAKYDSLVIIKAIGMVPDSIALMHSAEEAEKIAINMGIISRDTVKLAVSDSLFKEMKPEDMILVPFSNERFEMAATILETLSKTKEPAFEAKAHNDIILKGLNRQLIVNLNDDRTKNEKYPGLKVGSLTEVLTTGNWE
jgi:hypothetical protein